ncbi:hypothetical protein L484_010955 [Morus notabilis]|uniref:Uncharacterized protein n=1 Tax=Morus notabilis TaxID=981085 RepID=W9RZS5_9ROSA|nr:hypothetical protein L484_010955 [Morus notabilis]
MPKTKLGPYPLGNSPLPPMAPAAATLPDVIPLLLIRRRPLAGCWSSDLGDGNLDSLEELRGVWISFVAMGLSCDGLEWVDFRLPSVYVRQFDAPASIFP